MAMMSLFIQRLLVLRHCGFVHVRTMAERAFGMEMENLRVSTDIRTPRYKRGVVGPLSPPHTRHPQAIVRRPIAFNSSTIAESRVASFLSN